MTSPQKQRFEAARRKARASYLGGALAQALPSGYDRRKAVATTARNFESVVSEMVRLLEEVAA